MLICFYKFIGWLRNFSNTKNDTFEKTFTLTAFMLLVLDKSLLLTSDKITTSRQLDIYHMEVNA